MERIVIVDENDNYIGEEEKEKCHEGAGILHRAFLAMVFNPSGKLILTRRSRMKKLWPGFWDGTVASHVFKGETYEQASVRRLRQEIGLNVQDAAYLLKFHYMAGYEDIGTEHEICAVTVVRGVEEKALRPVEAEISEVKLLDMRSMAGEIVKNRNEYTPWLILALEHLQEHCGHDFPAPCLPKGGAVAV
jgi:isopentenyl-diphosphate delta-isomerase